MKSTLSEVAIDRERCGVSEQVKHTPTHSPFLGFASLSLFCKKNKKNLKVPQPIFEMENGQNLNAFGKRK
ncbi:hypothetical protein CsSME_00049806 [Camellia sinensis var. sinensis]